MAREGKIRKRPSRFRERRNRESLGREGLKDRLPGNVGFLSAAHPTRIVDPINRTNQRVVRNMKLLQAYKTPTVRLYICRSLLKCN